MRLFIAIPFDNTFKSALRDVQNEFRRQGVTGNYTRVDNLHMTLAFIGEHDEPARIMEVMRTVDFRPFTLRLAGTGSFGDIRWCGIDDCPEAFALAKQLRNALSAAGIPFDAKRFNPHITLIRKSRLPYGAAQTDVKVTRAEMRVDRFALMESARDKNGILVYTELGSAAAQAVDRPQ